MSKIIIDQFATKMLIIDWYWEYLHDQAHREESIHKNNNTTKVIRITLNTYIFLDVKYRIFRWFLP